MGRRTYGTGSLLEVPDKAGRPVYYGKWHHGGRQVKRRLGFRRTPGGSEGLTRAGAESALRDAMAEHEAIAATIPKPVTHRTLAAVAEEYLAVRRLKSSTAQDYRMHLRIHLLPFFGDRPLEAIDADAVTDLRDNLLHRRERPLKAKTVRSYLTTLSTLLNYAVRKGWLERSPMPAVDLPAVDEDLEAPLRYLRVFEVHDLANAARPGLHEHVDRALYLTAALTGLRQGELRGLTWENADMVAHRIQVERNIVRGKMTSPKSRKVRSVPMAPQVREALESLWEHSHWRADDDPVFAHPASGRPIARTPMMDRYRLALDAANLDVAFRFHDLRHTFGTSLAAAGEPVTTIQAYMGHSSLSTTQRYMHHAPAVDEAARIGRAFAVDDPRILAPVAVAT